MNFATFTYWGFLTVVVAGCWSIPNRFRKHWLILTSAIFYASWSFRYLALIILVSGLNFLGARWITAASGDRGKRGKWVVIANLAILVLFKYSGWLSQSADSLLTLCKIPLTLPIPHWILPLGISFFIFESISYIIDLIRRREKAHSFLDLLLFVIFFPKLIAGPILRVKEFLPQFNAPLRFSDQRARQGLRRIASGLLIKVVIADGFGHMVDEAFSKPMSGYTALDAWLIAIAFSLQIYLDFAAYSRMAIGSAALVGITLVENFDHPFIATTPPEFWRRWHMSLSRWVRDYLFYPMAQHSAPLKGSEKRIAFIRRLILVRAAFLSMVLFGIWHGAGGTFVLYGVVHGTALAVYYLATFREKQPPAALPPSAPHLPDHVKKIFFTAIGWVLTMGLVFLAMAIFRAPTVGQAIELCSRALSPLFHPGRTLKDVFVFRTLGLLTLIVTIGALSSTGFSASLAKKLAQLLSRIIYLSAVLEGLAIGIALVVSFLWMTGGPTFIYFQF